MALIVETGEGLSNSESYVSLADATARHTNLGNSAWAAAADDTAREQALRRATSYMEQAYRVRWTGCRVNLDQALSWPRYGAVIEGYPVPNDAVPAEVANACADLALKALAADLNADLTRGIVRKKIGPLETEFDPYSPQAPRYRAIDMMLAPFLTGGGANVRLERA